MMSYSKHLRTDELFQTSKGNINASFRQTLEKITKDGRFISLHEVSLTKLTKAHRKGKLQVNIAHKS